ncbi:unnamed protein product [Miscanthus lutarioriparius]|uniref:Uncharacterized protein n=1 Tax=Miscanthus lutarioriparius TaxID=422564 RepID=A0A811RSA9_9POAL|nr:unnamed protein product [Miscanthus lutarioriparius]
MAAAAQMVSSAVAQEAVSQALSNLKERYGHKSDGKEHMEMMEMTHIKLEAALETSNKWNITSLPLLRWQSKLKRAVQECDHTLRRCKQRLEEEERQHRQKDLRYDASRRSLSLQPLPCDVYLEPVTQVHLLGQVALLAGDNRQSAVVNREMCPMRGSSFLKLGGHLWPHASSEDMLPAVGGSATEMINREVAPCGLYANIYFEQLGEIMLPKAKDCLGGNVAATSYQMLWNSKHGSSYLQAKKTPWPPIPSGRRDRGGKNQKQSRFKKVLHPWTSETSEFLSSWILHAPAQLQASFVDWIENKKRPPLPLSSKITYCVHGCPMMSLSLPDYHASLARKIRSYSTFICLKDLMVPSICHPVIRALRSTRGCSL